MPLFLDRATPRHVIKHALRALYVTGPLSLLTLVAWGVRAPEALHVRPQLVLMVYLLLLAVSVCAAMVAALAACHLSVAKAFAAGVRAGQHAGPDVSSPPALRAVE